MENPRDTPRRGRDAAASSPALQKVIENGRRRRYDLSKVYQSLCGYDAIILDVELTAANEATLARLRGVFEAWLARRYSKIALRDIKLIVASHYFCIVPLHDNKVHQKQFLAKAKWLLDEDEASSDSSDSNQPLHP